MYNVDIRHTNNIQALSAVTKGGNTVVWAAFAAFPLEYLFAATFPLSLSTAERTNVRELATAHVVLSMVAKG